jgi:transcriptional regulator with XRE-family HTH domain
LRGNMRAERVRHGLTVEEAASAVGMHQNTLGKWERGEADPLAMNLVKLAALYDCSPEYLLGLTNDRGEKTAPSHH